MYRQVRRQHYNMYRPVREYQWRLRPALRGQILPPTQIEDYQHNIRTECFANGIIRFMGEWSNNNKNGVGILYYGNGTTEFEG